MFYLHDSFPKPKRVVKEPPFRIKESGWAGFDIPIEIHLKNKGEPKTMEVMYSLNLETTGTAVSHSTQHSRIIHNPTEEFRKKLVKGGAVSKNLLFSIEVLYQNLYKNFLSKKMVFYHNHWY